MTADEQVRLYPVAHLAKLWHVSPEYIYGEIRSGRLPTVEMGNGDRSKIRISSIDAAKWISQHRSQAVA